MRLGFARQYQKACIIIELGDSAEDVMEMADRENAIFIEGPNEVEDKAYCVKFPDRPKELYSASALRRSKTLS